MDGRKGRFCAHASGGRHGFSLVELFVSLFIAAATLTMLTSLYFQARAHQIESVAVAQATLLADSLLAEAETTPAAGRAALPGRGTYETPASHPGARLQFRWSRRFWPTSAGTTRVDVAVHWAHPNQAERSLRFAEEVYP